MLHVMAVAVPPASRASIGDVARLAGVSPITVSRVANGADSVAPATRDKVLAAMTKLGYAPNHAARALRSGSFGALGVVVHGLDRTGESRTVEAVVNAARDEGYTVSLIDLESPTQDAVRQAARRLSHQAVDGLVVIRAETVTPVSLALPVGLPVVVSASDLTGRLPAVGSDQAAGVRAAVTHLLDLGHRTVHHVAGPADSSPARIREEAWRQTLHDAGRPVPEVLRGGWTPEAGRQAGHALDPEATAVLCANDQAAAGLLLALHERGVSVPDQVSVVGFDDIMLAGYLWPPLTTVRQDFTLIGTELVAMLMEQVRHGTDLSSRYRVVPVDLVVRASTAAPAAGR